jgi:hypothetical protein
MRVKARNPTEEMSLMGRLSDQYLQGVKEQYSTDLLAIPTGGYFDGIPSPPHSFILTTRENSKEPPSEDIFAGDSLDWAMVDGFAPIGNVSWPSTDPAHEQYSNSLDPAGAVPRCQDPWSMEDAQHIKNGAKENAGIEAFIPDAGYPYDVLISREPLFSASRPVLPYYGPRSSYLVKENNHDQRQQLYEQDIAPPVCKSESSQEPPESHEHVFSAITGMGLEENPRGRKRKLTAEERRRTLEVRKDGACWACHLSKTKVYLTLMFQL